MVDGGNFALLRIPKLLRNTTSMQMGILVVQDFCNHCKGFVRLWVRGCWMRVQDSEA